ncbi:MAG: hypothetical protein WCW84_13825 [Sulfurimonas sp.]|jgi:hypothetical protein
MSTKIKLKLRGESLSIDKMILDILSVARYGEKYERDEVKKAVRSDLRDIVGPGESAPKLIEIYEAIMVSLLPVGKQKILLSSVYNTTTE